MIWIPCYKLDRGHVIQIHVDVAGRSFVTNHSKIESCLPISTSTIRSVGSLLCGQAGFNAAKSNEFFPVEIMQRNVQAFSLGLLVVTVGDFVKNDDNQSLIECEVARVDWLYHNCDDNKSCSREQKCQKFISH